MLIRERPTTRCPRTSVRGFYGAMHTSPERERWETHHGPGIGPAVESLARQRCESAVM